MSVDQLLAEAAAEGYQLNNLFQRGDAWQAEFYFDDGAGRTYGGRMRTGATAFEALQSALTHAREANPAKTADNLGDLLA